MKQTKGGKETNVAERDLSGSAWGTREGKWAQSTVLGTAYGRHWRLTGDNGGAWETVMGR